ALWTSERRKMPKLYRELAILRTGFAGGSRFVFSQHSKFSRAAGLSEEKVAAVPAWTSAEAFDAKERAVLGYVDAVVRGGPVSETVRRVLEAELSASEIVGLTMLIGLAWTETAIAGGFALPTEQTFVGWELYRGVAGVTL
ncbi:MAG: carboxymuconolactone decarboxylase family protein, partial [Tepidiformaceae bacterium]